MHSAVFLICFISASVTLLASLTLMVKCSLPYNKSGRAGVLYDSILVFLGVFCGLNTLFTVPVIFSRESETETAKIVYVISARRLVLVFLVDWR